MIYRYYDVKLMLNIYILLYVDVIDSSIYVDMIELFYFVIIIIIIIVIINIIISVSKVGIKSDDVTTKRYDRTILTHLHTLSHSHSFIHSITHSFTQLLPHSLNNSFIYSITHSFTHCHDHHSHFFQLTSTIVYVEWDCYSPSIINSIIINDTIKSSINIITINNMATRSIFPIFPSFCSCTSIIIYYL